MELINDHMYSICIAQNEAYCDIALTANNFDLTGTTGSCSDSIAFGLNLVCGSLSLSAHGTTPGPTSSPSCQTATTPRWSQDSISASCSSPAELRPVLSPPSDPPPQNNPHWIMFVF